MGVWEDEEEDGKGDVLLKGGEAVAVDLDVWIGEASNSCHCTEILLSIVSRLLLESIPSYGFSWKREAFTDRELRTWSKDLFSCIKRTMCLMSFSEFAPAETVLPATSTEAARRKAF